MYGGFPKKNSTKSKSRAKPAIDTIAIQGAINRHMTQAPTTYDEHHIYTARNPNGEYILQPDMTLENGLVRRWCFGAPTYLRDGKERRG